MSRHRADKWVLRRLAATPLGRRRIAGWPIAVLGLVVLVVLGAGAWIWVGGVLNQRTQAQAHSCSAGPLTVQVAAAPEIAVATRDAAATYNAQQQIVSDHCIQVVVSSVDPAVALAGLTGSWDTAKLGPQPQAWISDSSLWSNQLAGRNAGMIADTPESVASSPIVLAMPPDGARAVTGANSLTWAGVPGLLGSTAGWADLGEPNWGAFSVDLPDPTTNPASELALEAMVDPTTATGAGPLTSDVLATPSVSGALKTVATKQPSTLPSNTLTALLTLAKSPSVLGAPYAAVPVPEVALYERNIGTDGEPKPANVLDEVRLAGAAPVFDFPYVPLAGSWVTSDQDQAAQLFRTFLRSPAEQAQLAKAGLRTVKDIPHPEPSPGMDWGAVTTITVPTDPATAQRVTAAWTGAQGQPSG